jgi:hypothetical protein
MQQPRQTQTTLESFVTRTRVRSETHSQRTGVCSLFDANGLSLLPWVERGYRGVALRTDDAVVVGGIDAKIANLSNADAVAAELQTLGDLAFVFAIPPCSALCSAGARWWRKKRAQDANFQQTAASSILALKQKLLESGVPFCIVLPASGVVKRLVGSPDLVFHPHEFGAFLGAGAEHPLFPEVVPLEDRYTKKSFAYFGNGAVAPIKRNKTPRFTMISLKHGKKKRVSPVLASRRSKHTRALAPLGFSTAICACNAA